MHAGFYDLYMRPCSQEEGVLEADMPKERKRSPRQARAAATSPPAPCPLLPCATSPATFLVSLIAVLLAAVWTSLCASDSCALTPAL